MWCSGNQFYIINKSKGQFDFTDIPLYSNFTHEYGLIVVTEKLIYSNDH